MRISRLGSPIRLFWSMVVAKEHAWQSKARGDAFPKRDPTPGRIRNISFRLRSGMDGGELAAGFKPHDAITSGRLRQAALRRLNETATVNTL